MCWLSHCLDLLGDSVTFGSAYCPSSRSDQCRRAPVWTVVHLGLLQHITLTPAAHNRGCTQLALGLLPHTSVSVQFGICVRLLEVDDERLILVVIP